MTHSLVSGKIVEISRCKASLVLNRMVNFLLGAKDEAFVAGSVM